MQGKTVYLRRGRNGMSVAAPAFHMQKRTGELVLPGLLNVVYYSPK